MTSFPIRFYDPPPEAAEIGDISNDSNVVEDGLSLLVPEYVNTPRWQAWIGSSLKKIQEYEDTFWGIYDSGFNIDLSVGGALDVIGKFVRQPRGSLSGALTNDLYRLALRVAVLVRTSGGTREELITIARMYEALDDVPGAYVRLDYTDPAGIEIRIISEPVNDPSEVHKRLEAAAPPGVNVQTLTTPGGVSGTFRLGRAADYPAGSTTTGLASAASPGTIPGGVLATVTG